MHVNEDISVSPAKRLKIILVVFRFTLWALLEQDIKQPENGYEGNPIKFLNGKRNSTNKRENLITFQFKSNQTVSLHNGQSIGSADQAIKWT